METADGARRAAILRAAQELFARRGYAAVAMGDVADAVGITKAAIHYHFETKADLYAAVMLSVLAGIQTGIRAMSAGPGSAATKLHRLATYAIVSLQVNADLDAMMRDADEHLSETQRQELDQAHAGIMSALAALMQDGIATGELAPADPDFLALAFWHLVSGFAGRSGALRGYTGRPEVATALIEMFLHGAVSNQTRKGETGNE